MGPTVPPYHRKSLRLRLAQWLCLPLVEEINRLTGLLEHEREFTGRVLKLHADALAGLATDLNDLRNKFNSQPKVIEAIPRYKTARNWSEFRHAAESRPRGE